MNAITDAHEQVSFPLFLGLLQDCISLLSLKLGMTTWLTLADEMCAEVTYVTPECKL